MWIRATPTFLTDQRFSRSRSGIVARLGDYRACIRVSNEQYGAVFKRDSPLSRCDVVRKRRERDLDGNDVQALFLQQRHNLGPTGSVSPCAMD